MGGLRNKSTSLPKPKPVRMPLLDDKIVQDTRVRTAGGARARGGRESTILSNMIRGLTGSDGFLGR